MGPPSLLVPKPHAQFDIQELHIYREMKMSLFVLRLPEMHEDKSNSGGICGIGFQANGQVKRRINGQWTIVHEHH